ncbi:inner membrane metabolite transporter ydjE [Escherichia coli BIDMC 39]|nr:inner membrane metabolite transporter ydjE [Escherichia coli BIDMC 39]
MEQYDQIGARLDRLPLARFHYRIFGIISFSLLLTGFLGNDSNLLIVFYVQIMPDDFVMQLHRF